MIQDTDVKCVFQPTEFLCSVRKFEEFLPKIRYIVLASRLLAASLIMLLVLSFDAPNGIFVTAFMGGWLILALSFLFQMPIVFYIRHRLKLPFLRIEKLVQMAGMFSSDYETRSFIEPLYDAADELAASCNVVMRGRFYHFHLKSNPAEPLISISILSNDIVVGLGRNRPFQNHLLHAADSSYPNTPAIFILRELAQHHVPASQ